MPTIQEIIAKREELAKTNPNATNVDARKALTATVTTPVTPAPVAGVPPATPPATPTQTPSAPVTPPAPVVPQVTGVDGQKFTQAPVDPTTGLSKPIETAPITESVKAPAVTTPKPLKTEVPVDYTQAKGREQEITANLESFKAQGMTPEQILKASDYANASPEKKAMIEPYLKQTQPTIDSMFNSIVAKVDVPDAQKVLPSYKIAQNRYLKANMYASMTPSQVTQEMNASRLIEGSRTWEDLKTLNPKLAQDAQNLRIVNGSKSNIFTPVNNPDGTPVKDENGNPVVENNLIKTFTQDYLDDYGDFLREIYKPETMEEINAKIYTPDVKMAQEKATEIELELNAIEKDINSIEADIDKELAGTGATGSRARLEKVTRAEKLQNDYNSTLKKYETYANKANNLINQNTAIYQQAYKQNQALQNALATAGGAKFQSELALTTKKAEFEQKLAQQAQMASDPTTATNQIIDTFAEMGIMADRSRQEIITDVQNKVANGIPLGQALTELQTAFKSKPLYKSMMDAQMRSLAPQQAESRGFSFANIGDGVIAVQNPDTGAVEFKSAKGAILSTDASGNPVQVTSTSKTGNALLDVPEGTLIPTRLKALSPGNPGGKECGEYVNDIAGSSLFGNSMEDKKRVANETTGGIGKAIVWAPTQSELYKKYGHVGVIVGEEGDNWVVRSSNLRADGRVTTDLVPKSASRNYKTLKNVNIQPVKQETNNLATLGQFMKDNQETGVGYSNEDVKRFDAKIDKYIQNGDEEGMAIAYRKMLMQDKDFKEKFDQTQEFTNALDNVQTLISDYEKAGKSTNALKGMAEKIARKLGLTTDQALAQLQTQMGFTLANYIKSISGTAASDAEVQRLMGNMANIGNVSELNTTIVNQVKNTAQSGLKKMIDTRMYGMPEELKPKLFGDIYGQEINQSSPQSSQLDAEFEALYNNL